MPRALRLCCALLVLTVHGTLPGAPEEARVSVLAVPEAGAVPDAEVTGDGTVHVAWVAGENVLYALSRDGGKTLSAPLRVNSEADSSHPANTHRGPEIGLDAQGTVHVIWFQNGYQRKLPPEQWGVAYARLKVGAKAFEPSRNLSRRPSEGFSLAVGTDGAVAVCFLAAGAWTVNSSDGGATFAPPELVPNCNPCPCCATRAAFDAQGVLQLFLRQDLGSGKDNLRDMYLVGRGTDKAWTPALVSHRPWPIAACPMAGASCERVGTGLIVAWETENDLSFARLETPLKARPPAATTASGVGGKYPVASVAPDGVACLSWKKGAELHWQLFGPAGRACGPALSRLSGNGLRHAAVGLPDGRFLLVN